MRMDLYHILNRGVDGRNIFMDDADRIRFVHDLYEFNDTAPAPQFSRRSENVGLRCQTLRKRPPLPCGSRRPAHESGDSLVNSRYAIRRQLVKGEPPRLGYLNAIGDGFLPCVQRRLKYLCGALGVPIGPPVLADECRIQQSNTSLLLC